MPRPANVVRDFPTELNGKVDPVLYRRLEQIYHLIYALQQSQQEVPAQTRQIASAQLSQLLGSLREPLIGQETADPQLVAAAQAPGTGTVTSITVGTGLTGAPNPIIGAGTVSLSNIVGVAGSYTNANITVDGQGRITAAASGSTATDFADMMLLMGA